MEQSFGKKDIRILETTQMEREMDMEFILGQMELGLKVSIGMTSQMEKG